LIAVLHVWSVPRLHKEHQLPLQRSLEPAVGTVGSQCEMASSLRGHESGSRGTSSGEGTKDYQNIVRNVVNCRVCELAIAAIVTRSYDL
jgi:hypothetical protein